MRRSATAVSLLVTTASLVGLSASAATATTPERFSGTAHGSGTIDCGTFQDNFVDHGTYRGTTFFDTSGTPIKIVVHWKGISTDVNSVTGFTLHEFNTQLRVFDLRDETFSLSGGLIRMKFPGEGLLLHDTGRAVIDTSKGVFVFLSARHDVFELGDEAYCRALSPT